MSAVSNPVPIRTPDPVSPVTAPPKPQSGMPWKWLIALVVVAILGWAVYQSMATRQEQQASALPVFKTVKATQGTLDRTVRVAGQTAARSFTTITAPILRSPEGGRDLLLMKLTPNGSWVKKGQVIATLDAQAMQDHVDDLSDTIEAAQADVAKRKAEISIENEALQQTLRLAKSEFEKAKLEASAAEVRTDIERQLLQLSLEEADATYKQRQADVEFKKASNAASVRILELTTERHTRHRDRHKGDVLRATIHASMDGLAVMSPIFRGGEMAQIQEGDRVYPGQPFMKIVDPKTMQLEGTVNQAESSEFRIGQQARIRLDAFPGLEFNGKIYSIGALAVGGWRQNYYIRSVPVRLQIEGSDPRLIPDLSASGDVVLDRAENQTVIPRNAIASENGKTVAYVKKGDTFERRELKVGLMNDTHAAILEGIQPGDDVRLN